MAEIKSKTAITLVNNTGSIVGVRFRNSEAIEPILLEAGESKDVEPPESFDGGVWGVTSDYSAMDLPEALKPGGTVSFDVSANLP